MKAGIIAALFGAVFWPNLRRLWQKTNPIDGESNWGHAICVPIIGLYYLYVNREEITKAGPRQFIWGPIFRPGRLWVGGAMTLVGLALTFGAGKLGGSFYTYGTVLGQAALVYGGLILLIDWSLATLLFGIALYVYGIYPGQNDYIKDVGMIVALFGVCLLMSGWGVMKIAWFPVVYLICAIPWPGLVYSWVAGPLQELAANAAVGVLRVTGVQALCSGTKIIMPNISGGPPRTLNVAEACAGLRSLMTFISVGAAVAFLSARPLWQKILITASAVPIAVLCNVMRVAGQGLLDHYWSQTLSEGFAHQFVGMIMLIPAFFLILLVGWSLDHLFVEEVDDKRMLAARARQAAGALMPVTAMVPPPASRLVTPRMPPMKAPAIAPPTAKPQAAKAVAPVAKKIAPAKPAIPKAEKPAVKPPLDNVQPLPPRPASSRRVPPPAILPHQMPKPKPNDKNKPPEGTP